MGEKTDITHEMFFSGRRLRHVLFRRRLPQSLPCAPFFTSDPATSSAARSSPRFSPRCRGRLFTAMRPTGLRRGGREQPGAPADLQERREVDSPRRSTLTSIIGLRGEGGCGVLARGGGRGGRARLAGREGRAVGEDLKQRPVGWWRGWGRCVQGRVMRGTGTMVSGDVKGNQSNANIQGLVFSTIVDESDHGSHKSKRKKRKNRSPEHSYSTRGVRRPVKIGPHKSRELA